MGRGALAWQVPLVAALLGSPLLRCVRAGCSVQEQDWELCVHLGCPAPGRQPAGMGLQLHKAWRSGAWRCHLCSVSFGSQNKAAVGKNPSRKEGWESTKVGSRALNLNSLQRVSRTDHFPFFACRTGIQWKTSLFLFFLMNSLNSVSNCAQLLQPSADRLIVSRQ